MSTLFRFFEFEFCSSNHHFVSVLHKMIDQIFKIQQLRTPINESNVVDTKRRLKSCVLIKLVQNNIRDSIALKYINNTHSLTVRFVPNITNPFDFFVVDQFGSLTNHFRLVDLIGNFGHNNAFATINFLDGCLPSKHYPSTTGVESISDSVVPINGSSCRKIWSLNGLH